MSHFHFLRDVWRAIATPRPRCWCDDPRLNAVGGYRRGCPLHDSQVVTHG